MHLEERTQCGFIVQYSSILLGYCMTSKGQIIFRMGKTSLMSKPARVHTKQKKNQEQIKSTWVLAHLQVSRDSSHPADWGQTAHLTGDAGDHGRVRQVPPTVPASPSASQDVWFSGGRAGQIPLKTPHPCLRHSSHIPQRFEELELPEAELLHFFRCQGPTVGTGPKETGRRRFLKKERKRENNTGC